MACDRWKSSTVIDGWCRYSWNFHIPSENAVLCCDHKDRYFFLSGRYFVEIGNRINFALVDGDWHFKDGEGSLFAAFEVGGDAGAVHLEVLGFFHRENDDGRFFGAVFATAVPEISVSG